MGFFDRLAHSWNAFFGKGPPYKDEQVIVSKYMDYGISSSYRPDRIYSTRGQERSLINTVYNKIAIDVASADIRHVKLDDNNRFIEEVNSTLNECFKVEANKDQTGRQLMQDIVMSMFDEGCVAVVPVDTSANIYSDTASMDILTLRTGKIITWYPDDVQIELYNDKNGVTQQITLPKKRVAIIENPFYAIMNERNSVLQRLITKFNLLDVLDAQTGSGKLNLIIQLPYVVKTDTRRTQAESRRTDIENQLATSKYGIAYTDGTEKITQLNRPADNNLMNQIQYLTSMLFSQLGLTETILNGTANEETMLNYTNRTVVPILCAITEEFRRKFLTKTARTQKQEIMFFNNSFKFVPISKLAEVADTFTRNAIMSSNEIRQIIGLKPSDDPKADELSNKNLNESGDGNSVEDTQNNPANIENLDDSSANDNLGDVKISELSTE